MLCLFVFIVEAMCARRFEKWAELFGQTLYAVSAKATALTDLQTVRIYYVNRESFSIYVYGVTKYMSTAILAIKHHQLRS